ncbi:MAG: site-specific DNA-methyltransferase [Coriobacteriia bacterium]|nr:site-specific DNA-methyltransferase [Coriobacteriia bacterium]
MEKRLVERSKVIAYECAVCARATDAPEGTVRLERRLCRECFPKREDRRPKDLNDLTGKEWAQASKSVEQYPDTRSPKQKHHGACFPEALALHQIGIYTKTGGRVLDPFVGIGTTLDACAALGRLGVGLDINPDFITAAKNDLSNRNGGDKQSVIEADARNLLTYVEPDTIDFVLTSPPYGPLLQQSKQAFAYKWREHSRIKEMPNPLPYSNDDRDLGNLDYEDFLGALEEVLAGTLGALKSRGYAAWVVKDFRALKRGVPYVNFHGDLIERAQRVGFDLWDLRIYDQTKFRPLVCMGYPSSNFYLNIGHSYIVVLRKP